MIDLRRIGSERENKAVTVLVVEDEALMRAKLVEELQDAGYSFADDIGVNENTTCSVVR
jgi:CheY-like chemotaxis protein